MEEHQSRGNLVDDPQYQTFSVHFATGGRFGKSAKVYPNGIPPGGGIPYGANRQGQQSRQITDETEPGATRFYRAGALADTNWASRLQAALNKGHAQELSSQRVSFALSPKDLARFAAIAQKGFATFDCLLRRTEWKALARTRP